MFKTPFSLLYTIMLGTKRFSVWINAKYSLVIALSLLALLTSCSSQQAVTVPNDTQDIDEIITEPTNLNAQQHVELAQTAEPDVAISELINAAKLFYKEQNYLKALWLADKVIPMLDENTLNPVQENIQLSLIKASSLQQLDYYPQSITELNKLAVYAQNHSISLSKTFYRLQHAAFVYEKRPIAALNALLYQYHATESKLQQNELSLTITQEFSDLSQWQLNLIAKDNAPNSQGWVELTVLANKYSGNQTQLNYHVKMWGKKFKRHPARTVANQLLTTNLTEHEIKNIAVILPLSGNSKSAGLAIQQGILASFDNNPNQKIHFIDSNEVNWYGLTNELATNKINYVIGPLLKENVDNYIKHTSTESQAQNNYLLNSSASALSFDDFSAFNVSSAIEESANNENNLYSASKFDTGITQSEDSNIGSDEVMMPLSIPTLLLNIPEKQTRAINHTVLSMRPEDEAKQAATTLSRKNYQHPVVLSQQNSVSKRIAESFVKQWQHTTGKTIEIVYYDTGSQMQANIKSSLAVDKSKQRINSLKRQLNKSIKTQTRNRRDIDMIYLVGNPEQTRLVKPYIEVNISPFADIIPVFASSRSHSTMNDYSSNTDLQGLIFTEIPWLLKEKQNHKLAELSQTIWPKRTDGLSRLFAMGYDSYQLTSKISLMQQAPYLQHWGQTGILKLGENGILTRSFFWGEYKRNRVATIAME